jgi:hypothetical protein
MQKGGTIMETERLIIKDEEPDTLNGNVGFVDLAKQLAAEKVHNQNLKARIDEQENEVVYLRGLLQIYLAEMVDNF